MPGAAGRGRARGIGKKGAPGAAFEARLATALDAEAERLLGDGVLDGIGFERLERACRRVALEAMGRALAARLNADRSDERGPRLACPRRDEPGHGDGLARHAGRRAKTFVTALGEMEFSRAWYHCDACGRGFAPRDRELGFGDGGPSPAVLRMVGRAAGEVSFATAGSLPHELAGMNVVASRLKRGGMRWTGAGADAILALRSYIVSNRFDDFWQRRAAAK